MAQQHRVILRDVWHDYDYDESYVGYPQGRITISIENDDSDMHPGIAAQYLWRGLNEALKNTHFRKAVQEAEGGLESTVEIAALTSWRAEVGPAACEAGVAAAGLYLSGIGIVCGPVETIILVNDLSQGHCSAMAAAMPFLPRALVKAKPMKWVRKSSGETLETIGDVAKLDAAKGLFGRRSLRDAGVTMEEYQFNRFIRKAMTEAGGPIQAPLRREGLREGMERVSLIPKHAYPNPQAHHDFPWKHKDWFAEHGIDVNNPAFGRWVKRERHTYIEKQAPINYEVHWDQIRALEDSLSPYTFDQLMEKLAIARAGFPIP